MNDKKITCTVNVRDLKAGDKILEIHDYGSGRLFKVRRLAPPPTKGDDASNAAFEKMWGKPSLLVYPPNSPLRKKVA